jgi:hypothetical protein
VIAHGAEMHLFHETSLAITVGVNLCGSGQELVIMEQYDDAY